MMPDPVGYEVFVQCEVVIGGKASQIAPRHFRQALSNVKAALDQEPVCEIVADRASFSQVFEYSKPQPGCFRSYGGARDKTRA